MWVKKTVATNRIKLNSITMRLDPDKSFISFFFWRRIKTVKINSKGPVVQAAESEKKST